MIVNSKRQIFLPCKGREVDKNNKPTKKNNFCYPIPRTINYFSKDAMVDFPKWTKSKEPMTILKAKKEVCEAYWNKADEAYQENERERGSRPTKSFGERADRVIIMKGRKVEEVCYNVRKLGKYGICQTKEGRPYNWGFCSRACIIEQEIPSNEPGYEEMKATYFDDAPPNSKHQKGDESNITQFNFL